MVKSSTKGGRSVTWPWLGSSLACAGLTAVLVLGGGRAAYTRSVHEGITIKGMRIPAFARKYGLRCSACHTVWPELNAFGQRFKDNG